MNDMLHDLLNPESLPDETREVRLVQTHISSVLIADHYAYKMKKPVNFGFLDFSSLEKRKHYCEQEVLLNQRLAADVYLEVLPVRRDGVRHSLGKGTGTIVEYAVKMRRIPDEVLMLNVFRRGLLQADHLRRIARVLSRFHAAARHSAAIAEYGDSRAFQINTDENFAQTRAYIGRTIDAADFSLLQQWTGDFYGRHKDLFDCRKEQGKIRDCHGDLHMAHVCLFDPIAVIDCIEFNERFRYSDTLADIAFLLMDLDYQGGNTLARQLWDLYARETGEGEMEALLTFYKTYRAYVRGKVIGFQLDDPHLPEKEKNQIRRNARKYFKLAVSYIE